MQTILVTGGSGFIGGTFVRALSKFINDVRLVNLDALTYAGASEEANKTHWAKKGHYEFIHGDIRDELLVKRIYSKYEPKITIHFAAESHVTRSETNGDLFWDVNVNGTKNLINRSYHQDRRACFVHISTDEVYGPCPAGEYFNETSAIGEGHATSNYALSKAEADSIVQKYMKKMPVILLRPTNNFGPYQMTEKFFPRSVIRAINEKPIVVWGNGQQIRDWLYVEDTASAILNVISKFDMSDTGIYNLGAGNSPEITNLMVAKFVAKFMGRPRGFQLISDPRPDHDERYAVDSSKLIQRLKSKPSTPPWSNMEKTIAWYMKNPAWYLTHFYQTEELYA